MSSLGPHQPGATSQAKATWARFVPLDENRAAHEAALLIADALAADQPAPPFSPLTIHGPPGTGKSHLVLGLIDRVARQAPSQTAQVLTPDTDPGEVADERAWQRPLAEVDLLILEDLHRLHPSHAERMVAILDQRLVHQRPTVVTATDGPQRWAHLSARLRSRLTAGLVVGIAALGPASRRRLALELAQRRQLPLSAEVLAWLAEHSGSARDLEGALNRADLLARMHSRPLDLSIIAHQFEPEAKRPIPTIDHIAERVGGYFRVGPRQLQSARRHRNIVLPRQVSMYLARELTGLSLGAIGAWFGGRDHTTVLHACRKVEEALADDAALGGAVRQLRADLT